MNVDYLSDNGIDNNIIDPELLKNHGNLLNIVNQFDNQSLPDEVESAAKKAEILNRLNNLAGDLNNYLNELKNNPSTNPDEIICLEECIKNNFNLGEQGVQDILDARSKRMTIADFMGKYKLFINETKTGAQGGKIKWKEVMSDETKVFIATRFNEIFRLL